MLHDDPKTALVIGLGTGESAGWLAEMRNIERVDVLELEPAIDEMASRCSSVNRDVLHHPRVRRIYDDGREFVFTTKNKYDLIISEPSNPYRAGVASLYTTEFYQAVRKCLNPGGLLVQWLQAYEISDSTVGTVLATVGTEFVDVEVWQTLPADLQLICSATPLQNTAAELRERIGSGTVREALAKSWSVYDLDGFLAHYVASPGWAKQIAQAPFIASNTDDRTLLEYGFAKSVGRMTPFSVEMVRSVLVERNYHRPSLGDDSIDWDRIELQRQLFNGLYQGQISDALLRATADRDFVAAVNHFVNGDYASAIAAWPAEHLHPTDELQRLVLARCYAELGRPECLELVALEAERHPTEVATIRGTYHVQKKEWDQAFRAFDEFLARLAVDPWLVPRVTNDSFSNLLEVAKADAAAAEKLYPRLTKPYAANRLNYNRQVIRVMVAGELSPQRVVEALAEMEPNVVWTGDVLAMRAKSYAAVNHPLAARAQLDWERFKRDRPVD